MSEDPKPNRGIDMMRGAVKLLRDALPQTFEAANSSVATPDAVMAGLLSDTAFMSRDKRDRVMVQCVCCAQLLEGLLAMYEEMLAKIRPVRRRE